MTRKSSFPPVAAADARLLVLGSLPGDRSLAEARYYAHPQNQFWRLLSPVIDRDLMALDYEDRLAALLARGIGRTYLDTTVDLDDVAAFLDAEPR